MPEQLAFQQVLAERRAVDTRKGPLGARRAGVNRAREDLLTDAVSPSRSTLMSDAAARSACRYRVRMFASPMITPAAIVSGK